jgi:hypothetical protein
MDHNRKQGQDAPRQDSTERGKGSEGERNRSSEGSGISNRGSEREMREQQDLPPRGGSRSDDSDAADQGSESDR